MKYRVELIKHWEFEIEAKDSASAECILFSPEFESARADAEDWNEIVIKRLRKPKPLTRRKTVSHDKR